MSPKVSKPAQPYLGTAVIEYFYVGAESQVHDVYRHIKGATGGGPESMGSQRVGHD